MSYLEEIRSCILKEGIINTHSHHLGDSDSAQMNLERILQNSYVSWCGEAVPSSASGVDTWLEKIGNRHYYISLSRALQKLYSMEDPLNSSTWDEYDRRIKTAYMNTGWHLEILQRICAYQTVVLDAYWKPGDNNGHPEIFKPAFRINSFLFGYNREAKDHGGTNAQLIYGKHIEDIKTYTDFMYRTIKEKKEGGCSALKSAIAYDRTIETETASAEEAQAAMGFDRGVIPAASIRKFQDYVFDTICEMAADLKIPFQIHTGLGQMAGTNAMKLQSLIAGHPKTNFVLMHGSYPWLDDICGLVHVYPNVIVDLCWLPLISPAAAARFLDELLEVCNRDKIVWGCDTWTGEESWGALLSMADVLAAVLDKKISAGYFNKNDALLIAENIMRNNAKHWFCL